MIVGLGNPGDEYAHTRHNVGFMVVDRLALTGGVEFKKFKTKALGALMKRTGGSDVFFLKPQTFMNLSGEATRQALDFYKISSEALLVVYDDLDLPLGKLRFARSGSSGGHKGITSIIEHLGTNQFDRLRVGIGRPQERGGTVGYVLSPFSKQETLLLKESLNLACEATEFYWDHGVEKAMNKFN